MSRRTALAAIGEMLAGRVSDALSTAKQADAIGARAIRDRAKARAQAYRAALDEFERIVAEHVRPD